MDHRGATEPPLRPRRSLLFFPGVRPDQLDKAIRSGADVVCMDLEDAVARDRKDEARTAALERLRQPHGSRAEVVLRINSPRTEAGLRDILALIGTDAAFDALMLPKVESAEEVRWVEDLLAMSLPSLRLLPMVETPEGLEHAAAIAAASPRVTAMMFGGVDLSTELGCSMDWDSLLYARARVVHAARRAGVDAIDMPLLDTRDADRLAADAGAAARLGFTGKAAIHPAQIAVIQQAFSPTDAEIRRAEVVVEAYERNRGGVLLVDGKLVERPVIRAAQRTLALAATMGNRPGD